MTRREDMSKSGDGFRPRSKSTAALSLLGRARDTDGSASTPAGCSMPVSYPPPATATVSMTAQQINRSHASRMPVAGSVSGRSPSNLAIRPATARLSSLYDKGGSIEHSVRKFRIVEALRSGDTASISRAIRETSDSAPRKSVSSTSTLSGGALEDTTVLHLAIQCAELPVVEYVISDGAGYVDINARDKDGNTPLHVAAAQGRTQVVKLLLEHKDINDAVGNLQGKIPLDLARNAEIYQLLQLSRSLFAEGKIRQVQELIGLQEYQTLEQVLEETRLKTVLDINSTEFVVDPVTVQAGGTLLHEAARKKNTTLIQLLLLHGADPFRRDRKGKLPQDVTKDDVTRAMLKKSPAAQAAQQGIQEKAVLGTASQAAAAAPGDPLAGKEAREMRGYLKKWTNYRKGYQLRWFALEDGVLSYYKHQDDSGSACRGAINMRIAKLNMSPDEKTKFEIIGKSSVKYTLKANHEVEAKRWFWALNNAIQWTKDQAKEEARQRAANAELLSKVKEHAHAGSSSEAVNENANIVEPPPRASVQLSRLVSASKSQGKVSYGGSVVEEDENVETDHDTRAGRSVMHEDEDDDYGDASSGREQPLNTGKDAFNITAQSLKLQLNTIAEVNAALVAEASLNPSVKLSDPKAAGALATYDAAIRSMSGLMGDLMRISRDRDAYWQDRLDRETDMRRMWEEGMAQVAQEQEVLQARIGEVEEKRKQTKRMLKEVVNSNKADSQPSTELREEGQGGQDGRDGRGGQDDAAGASQTSPTTPLSRHETVFTEFANMSDDETGEEEFFDAVDAGEIQAEPLPPGPAASEEGSRELVATEGILNISSSFHGYESGVRTKLKIDADNRPKISLWGILKSMIGKDMTKMTLPVTFNEPTSLLYRCGEDMEYADLLDLAAARSDSIERLLYIAAFAASEYASTIGRVAKPFNPLLGETFEYVRPDKNYRFFIEQVSHHPPVGAAWAESPKWTYYGESAVKSKFYGRSFDINPLGTWFLKLRPNAGGKEDFYTWKKVTTSVVGIITGNPTVDNYGPMEVKNWTTGEVCHLDFKPRGWKESSAYQIGGKIVDGNGKVRISIGGRWNSKLYARVTPGYETTVEAPSDSGSNDNSSSTAKGNPFGDANKAFLIWQANERPKGIPFNLTPFVLTFNHLDDQLRPWIAPTDSRLRPDQRAMEEGQYDLAATEKNRLEEGQRARRREREAKGEDFSPAWFAKQKCEVTGEQYWKFSGRYWQQREKAGRGDETAWQGLEKIYS